MKYQLKLKNTDIKQFNTKNTKNSGTWPGNTDQITNTKFALKKHPTKAYKYDICKVQNNVCPHSTFKYANCEENHRANSPKYKIIKKITKKYSKKSSSNQKQLNNMN